MKKLYSLLFALVVLHSVNAQNPITNPGFENWTGNTPTGWSADAVTKSTNAYSGQFAARGEKTQGGLDPDLYFGPGIGFPVTTHYLYLNFYYIFNKVGSESFSLSLAIKNSTTQQTVGYVNADISSASSGWKAFSQQIDYTGSGEDVGTLEFFLLNNNAGSYFIIDDVALSMTPIATAVQDIEKEASSLRVYPNPANKMVQINFNNLNGKEAQIQITDMLGQVVSELSAVSKYVTVDISSLPAGNYMVAVKNDEMIQTKRLMVE